MSVDFDALADELRTRLSLSVESSKKACVVQIGQVISFSVLERILNIVGQIGGRKLSTAIYSSLDSIELTITLTRADSQTDLIPNEKSKKRHFDDDNTHNDDIDSDKIDGTLKKFNDSVTGELLLSTRTILEKVLLLRGSGRERIVQSFGLFHRKLRASDSEKRLLVAFSINAGMTCRVSALKRCMAESWQDGIATTSEDVDGVGKVVLPLTAEGTTSASFGNLPIIVIAAVVVVV